jgi:hypothetical protein
LHLNKGLEKNNTGFDFKNLFVGSEGTLGFITKATLKLTKPPKDPLWKYILVIALVIIFLLIREHRGKKKNT